MVLLISETYTLELLELLSVVLTHFPSVFARETDEDDIDSRGDGGRAKRGGAGTEVDEADVKRDEAVTKGDEAVTEDDKAEAKGDEAGGTGIEGDVADADDEADSLAAGRSPEH